MHIRDRAITDNTIYIISDFEITAIPVSYMKTQFFSGTQVH